MSQKKLYVGNLSYNTDESSLKDAFGKFGEIASIALIKDKFTGQSKGFGFIEFETQSAMQDALELNGTDLDRRSIKVSVAKEREARSGSGRY